MGVERIDSIYDLSVLTPEHEKFLALLKESKAAIIELNGLRIGAKTTDLAGLTTATEKLNTAINNTTKATEIAVAAGKEKIQVSGKEYQAILAEIEAKKKNTAAENESTKGKKENTAAD
jgi:hypothetical protein